MSDLIEIELQEDGRRPEVERIHLAPGEDFRIVFSNVEPPLRRFLLRGGDRLLGEPDELPFLWLRAPDAARPWMRVTQVDADVVDVPRLRTADKLLVAVEQDRKLTGRSTLVVKPHSERAIDLELRVAGRRGLALTTRGRSEGVAGADEGEGEGEPDLDRETPELDWQVPGVWESYGQPLIRRYQALRERIFQKLRPPPGLARGVVVAGSMLALAGFSLYSGRDARRARQEASQAQTSLENATEATNASAEDAGACRSELAELQRGMMTPGAARRSLILAALDPTRARAAFIAGVSQTGERDEALGVGEQTRPELVALVDAELADIVFTGADRLWCERREEFAGGAPVGLSRHPVFWYPSPDLPADTDPIRWSRGGASLRGPFLLGERPLRMLGGFEGPLDSAQGELADPRPQMDWSLQTFAEGLERTRATLLAWSGSSTGGGGRRMAVPPEELHLWSLALYSAWNEMPMDEGAGSIGECTRLLLDSVAARRTAEPGDAVLPSFLQILEAGEWIVPVGRTAACPWRDADLLEGVASSLASVVREVAFRESPE
mgnify:CR=1 FL=1